MLCERPGCNNEVPPSKSRPRKFCIDPECIKIRRREENNLAAFRKREKERNGTEFPSFICEGCGLLIHQQDFIHRKYCIGSECQEKRIYKNIIGHRKDHPYISKRKPKPEKTVLVDKTKETLQDIIHSEKIKPVKFSNKPSSVGIFADPASIDRSKKSGFERYMQENPFYLQYAFPGMSIKEAWKDSQQYMKG